MSKVFDHLLGSRHVADTLAAAAVPESLSLTHAWLFTGPPGSGRSIAARCFAAALQCEVVQENPPGCGECASCRSVLAGTHPDIFHIIPEGLSISVREIREVVRAAACQPSVGRHQIVLIEDADRLTEGAANALLKSVEEPGSKTIFLLCAPSDSPVDIAVTIRSRCRRVAMAVPTAAMITTFLMRHDHVAEDVATWAARVCGGHVGRARMLAKDEAARNNRVEALEFVAASLRVDTAYLAVQRFVAAADRAARTVSTHYDAQELDQLKTAFGIGGTGKGIAAATREMSSAAKALERRQKSRTTRMNRDMLDIALTDMSGIFRDALVSVFASSSSSIHPDYIDVTEQLAQRMGAESLLHCLDAIEVCRHSLGHNVKPQYAFAAMQSQWQQCLGHSRF